MHCGNTGGDRSRIKDHILHAVEYSNAFSLHNMKMTCVKEYEMNVVVQHKSSSVDIIYSFVDLKYSSALANLAFASMILAGKFT